MDDLDKFFNGTVRSVQINENDRLPVEKALDFKYSSNNRNKTGTIIISQDDSEIKERKFTGDELQEAKRLPQSTQLPKALNDSPPTLIPAELDREKSSLFSGLVNSFNKVKNIFSSCQNDLKSSQDLHSTQQRESDQDSLLGSPLLSQQLSLGKLQSHQSVIQNEISNNIHQTEESPTMIISDSTLSQSQTKSQSQSKLGLQSPNKQSKQEALKSPTKESKVQSSHLQFSDLLLPGPPYKSSQNSTYRKHKNSKTLINYTKPLRSKNEPDTVYSDTVFLLSKSKNKTQKDRTKSRKTRNVHNSFDDSTDNESSDSNCSKNTESIFNENQRIVSNGLRTISTDKIGKITGRKFYTSEKIGVNSEMNLNSGGLFDDVDKAKKQRKEPLIKNHDFSGEQKSTKSSTFASPTKEKVKENINQPTENLSTTPVGALRITKKRAKVRKPIRLDMKDAIIKNIPTRLDKPQPKVEHKAAKKPVHKPEIRDKVPKKIHSSDINVVNSTITKKIENSPLSFAGLNENIVETIQESDPDSDIEMFYEKLTILEDESDNENTNFKPDVCLLSESDSEVLLNEKSGSNQSELSKISNIQQTQQTKQVHKETSISDNDMHVHTGVEKRTQIDHDVLDDNQKRTTPKSMLMENAFKNRSEDNLAHHSTSSSLSSLSSSSLESENNSLLSHSHSHINSDKPFNPLDAKNTTKNDTNVDSSPDSNDKESPRDSVFFDTQAVNELLQTIKDDVELESESQSQTGMEQKPMVCANSDAAPEAAEHNLERKVPFIIENSTENSDFLAEHDAKKVDNLENDVEKKASFIGQITSEEAVLQSLGGVPSYMKEYIAIETKQDEYPYYSHLFVTEDSNDGEDEDTVQSIIQEEVLKTSQLINADDSEEPDEEIIIAKRTRKKLQIEDKLKKLAKYKRKKLYNEYDAYSDNDSISDDSSGEDDKEAQKSEDDSKDYNYKNDKDFETSSRQQDTGNEFVVQDTEVSYEYSSDDLAKHESILNKKRKKKQCRQPKIDEKVPAESPSLKRKKVSESLEYSNPGKYYTESNKVNVINLDSDLDDEFEMTKENLIVDRRKRRLRGERKRRRTVSNNILENIIISDSDDNDGNNNSHSSHNSSRNNKNRTYKAMKKGKLKQGPISDRSAKERLDFDSSEKKRVKSKKLRLKRIKRILDTADLDRFNQRLNMFHGKNLVKH